MTDRTPPLRPDMVHKVEPPREVVVERELGLAQKLWNLGWIRKSMVIAVLALIIGWFAVQSRQWWWLPLPAAIAVVWNPVIPLALADAVWLPLQYAAAAGFIVAGLVIRVSDHDR